MGRGRLFRGLLIVLLIFVVSGCGTAKKRVTLKEEVAGIKTKVDTLESRVEGVEAKQTDVERTASEHAQFIEELKTAKEKPAARTNIAIKPRRGKSKERIKEIQVYLKNAGFYSGRIDGVKGRNTRKAIKEFQHANGLAADGIVGPKTWELLSKYSSGAASPGFEAEEGATK